MPSSSPAPDVRTQHVRLLAWGQINRWSRAANFSLLATGHLALHRQTGPLEGCKCFETGCFTLDERRSLGWPLPCWMTSESQGNSMNLALAFDFRCS